MYLSTPVVMACITRETRTYVLLRLCGVLALLTISGLNVTPGIGVLAQTYTLSDGDVVDCIPIVDQTSLNGLTAPTYNKFPTTVIRSSNPTVFPDSAAVVAVQTFTAEVGSCPNDNIPVRRTNGDLESSDLNVQYQKRRAPPQDSSEDTGHHEYAIGNANAFPAGGYKGTEVVMNIWDPYVENTTEFSLAQLWLLAGDPLNTVEVGYQVFEGLGGDTLPRLFVFWTANDYNDPVTCYDLICSGFIQVSNKVLIRGSFTPVSTTAGQRYEIKILVFKDDVTNDWWLQLNDEYVGYWPAAIYTANGLQGTASTLQWGGEIYTADQDGNLHTKTDMGSGSEEIDSSAYMRNLKFVDMNNNLVDSSFYVFNTSAPCYSVEKGNIAQIPDWGSYFYFGGPGYNSQCLTDVGSGS